MKKKDFIAKYSGKKFKRIVQKGSTIEDIPQIKQELEEMLSVDGRGYTYKEDEFGYAILNEKGQETGERFMRPVMHRETIGVLTFTSNSTKFEADGSVVTGDIPPAKNIDEDGFTADYGNFVYRYEVIKEEK